MHYYHEVSFQGFAPDPTDASPLDFTGGHGHPSRDLQILLPKKIPSYATAQHVKACSQQMN